MGRIRKREILMNEKVIKCLLLVFLSLFSLSLFAIVDDSNYNNTMYKNIFPLFNFTNPNKYRPKYFGGTDNIKIAYDIFGPKDAQFAIVLLPGKSESFVKYSEFIYDLENLSLNKIKFFVMDHRGLGFSERFDTQAQGCSHVDRFDNCVEDVKIFMDSIVRKNWNWQSKPVFLFSHSMGGGIAARFLEKHHGYFSKAIFCSPMIQPITTISDVFSEDVNIEITFIMATTMCFFSSTKYALGQGDREEIKPFENNDVSHSRNRYYNWQKNLEGDKANPGLFPEIVSAGVTWNWLKQACRLSDDIIHSAKDKREIENIPILILQSGSESIVSNDKENYFAKYSPNCKVAEFPKSFHEIYNETDDIRGDGVHLPKDYATNPNTVMDYTLSFFDIPAKSLE